MQTKNKTLPASQVEACKRGILPRLMTAVSWLFRRRGQRMLNRVDHLDVHGLKDIGLDMHDAGSIAAKVRDDAFRLLIIRVSL